MRFRSILLSLILAPLAVSNCSNTKPVEISGITPGLIVNTDQAKSLVITGTGFSQSSLTIGQVKVGTIVGFPRVQSDDVISVTIAPNRSLCGPVTVKLTNNSDVYASSEQFSFYAERSDFEAPKYVNKGDAEISGMAAADFNQDEYTDLVLAKENENNIQIYMGRDAGSEESIRLGKSNGTFEDQPISLAVDKPSAVVTGDFDLDAAHTVDLFVIHTNRTKLSLILNNGNRSFQAPVEVLGLTTGEEFKALITGSLSSAASAVPTIGVVIANADGTNAKVRLLQRQQNGSFAALPDQNLYSAAADKFKSIAATDVDLDGNLDLVVAFDGSKDLKIKLGQGNGTFALESTFTLSFVPQYLLAADFNSDKKVDLAVVDNNVKKNTIHILKGEGSALFQVQTFSGSNAEMTFGAGLEPTLGTVGDFNGDRKPDVILASKDPTNMNLAAHARAAFLMSQCPLN